MENLPAARAWAMTAFWLGVAVSVAANVAHTYYVPGASGRPPVGAQAAAAFYPLALLLVVEILARVPWPSSLRWSVARYGGASAVALVAAVVSYRHMSALLTAYGEDALTATIGPLAVDGLMVVASLALLAVGRQSHAQAAPAAVPDETLVAEPDDAEPWTDDRPVGMELWATLPAIESGGESAPGPVATALSETTEDEPDQVADLQLDPDLAPVVATARERFAELLATGGLPSVRALRRELRIGHPRAVRVRAALESEGARESTLATA